jgi:hypothetical protein
VEARSATSAAERVASVVEARTRTARVRTRTVTIHATASTARTTEEIVAEEEVDRHAIPGSASPFILPMRARAYARSGERVTIEWISEGDPPLSHVTVAVTESLVIGLFEHQPPLTGADAAGHPMVARGRHVVVEVDDLPALPARFPVLDRYSGEYLPAGNDHPETSAIKPFIYAADGPDATSRGKSSIYDGGLARAWPIVVSPRSHIRVTSPRSSAASTVASAGAWRRVRLG